MHWLKPSDVKYHKTNNMENALPNQTESDCLQCHVQNLQKLMTEIYMLLNNMNPSIVWEFHEKKHVAYDLRKKNLCKLPKAKTTSYGVESLSFRSFLWNTLDDNVKQEPALARFKNKIRNWACVLRSAYSVGSLCIVSASTSSTSSSPLKTRS